MQETADSLAETLIWNFFVFCYAVSRMPWLYINEQIRGSSKRHENIDKL
jgi:hypothetical protein